MPRVPRQPARPAATAEAGPSPELSAFLTAVEAGKPLAYAELLGLRPSTGWRLHESARAGLSFQSVERIHRSLDLPAAELAALLVIPERTLHRRKREGRLRADESDRLLRLARVVGKALELFEGDLPAARGWLATPHAALADRTPYELIQSEPGVAEVEALIGRLEHGVFA